MLPGDGSAHGQRSVGVATGRDALATNSCPVPTPAERRYGEILGRIEQDMIRSVYAALQEAGDRVQAEIGAAGLDMPPPSHDYLAATLHQRLFCTLCGANPEDFSGGRADIAIAIIRNSQRIARHHWGAEIDVDAKPERSSNRSSA